MGKELFSNCYISETKKSYRNKTLTPFFSKFCPDSQIWMNSCLAGKNTLKTTIHEKKTTFCRTVQFS